MLEVFNRYWRVVGTGISFASFGVGGLLLRVLVFPTMNIFVWNASRRKTAARNVIRLTFRAFVRMMVGLRVLRYEIKGLEKLERRGLLILANHPTLIDTVFLMSFVKQADCIVKNQLWNNPVTHGPVRAAGYINNTSGPELIEQCIKSIQQGSNLIVFPEGTRTRRDGSICFKRGAANIAVRGNIDVTPVLIRCTPSTLGKEDKWWKVPARRVQLTIEVRDDIPIHPFIAAADNEAIAARRLTEYLQHFFVEENKGHAVA
ncbi:lysophospholipid acyltransferase family protein [Noviherbaspirillum saxi]|uniref:1-acyl-sn-glycerol-3-phosphate acyltransferase n=1 Tax=Noviherbaspirillum saxi TaxID=2320863 RepID=A0A3A3G4Z7_9BURK|nr:lysophospholipid acyltransferase family protein [Noviherbaspirillum saxi]RJF97205.1 1-acyl-sn-glycerol-3-phosphate acyltransferase [Noviherbaspirillum saxi]